MNRKKFSKQTAGPVSETVVMATDANGIVTHAAVTPSNAVGTKPDADGVELTKDISPSGADETVADATRTVLIGKKR